VRDASSQNSDWPPALVLAPGNYVAPLGVMRSLRSLGVGVFGLETSGVSLWKHSRHCAGLLRIGENGSPSRTDPRATLAELLQAGHLLGGGAVLIPCSDEWALFIARHAEPLASVYRFARLTDQLATQLGDKQVLQSLASHAGVAVPESVQPADRAELAELAPMLDYPIMVKTAVTRSAGNQMAVVHSPDFLVQTFDRLNDPGNLICQRLVSGTDEDGWLFNGYFDDQSRCVASFSGRKLRQWPPGRGVTVLAEAKRNPEVEEISIRFLESVGYRGAVDMDFIRDSADGVYKLLDVNPRLGGVFRCFEDTAGLDVARVMYLDLIGQSVRQQGQREPHRFVHEGGYVVSTLKVKGLSAPMAAWREIRRAEMGTFKASDPLPFVIQMASTVRVHAGARLRRHHEMSAHDGLNLKPVR
jgi:D-aspartate ligase